MVKKILSVFIAALMLSACATSYKARGFNGGYSDMQLTKDTCRVSFKGNSVTSQETTETFLLRRCAEVTVERSYRYFIILDKGTSVESSYVDVPAHIDSSEVAKTEHQGNREIAIANKHTSVSEGRVEKVNRYTSYALIKMLYSNKNFQNAYDANIILSNFNH